jgi:hypothetical protein
MQPAGVAMSDWWWILKLALTVISLVILVWIISPRIFFNGDKPQCPPFG